MLPPELLDLILSWHTPVCAQAFAGNPRYILYWCYDKGALREVLGMTRDQYRVVQSSLGKFMRRVPKTNQWLSKLSICGDGGLQTHEPRIPTQARGRRSGLAAARHPIARKSYVGLAPPEIKQFT